MNKLKPIIIIVSLFTIALVLLNNPTAGVKSAEPAAVSGLTRDLEPVIITGSQLPLFNSVDISDMFGYGYHDGSWKAIPLQIDEIDSDGEYAPEDGLLDGNDELVFMSMDSGEKVDLTQWISDTDSQQYSRYQVNVTNPLNTTDQGWIYIYRSSTLTPPSTDYVNWNPTNQRITGGTYKVGLNTTDFFGIDYLEVNGNAVDIFDRSKFRVSATCIILPINLNEESELLLSQIPDITPNIDGPVRVGGGDTLASIWSYHSLFNIDVGLDIDSLDIPICGSGFKINSVRVSFDLLDPTNSGMAPTTYYDPNTPDGVTVNGLNDSIPTTPTKTWSQISGGLGSFVQLIDLNLGSGSISNYYKDDLNSASEDTGDKKSYGDAGMFVTDPSGELAFKMGNYILPASQPNVGATYQSYKDNPLQVNVFNQTYNCKPHEVEITAPDTAQVDAEVKFEAIVGKGLEPFTYNWDFGDGSSTGSGNPAVHAYEDCADYEVSVEVNNSCGSAVSTTHTIKIEGCQENQEEYYLPLVNSSNP